MSKSGKEIPAFVSGPAETNWYLKVDFRRRSMVVTPISSREGDIRYKADGVDPTTKRLICREWVVTY